MKIATKYRRNIIFPKAREKRKYSSGINCEYSNISSMLATKASIDIPKIKILFLKCYNYKSTSTK